MKTECRMSGLFLITKLLNKKMTIRCTITVVHMTGAFEFFGCHMIALCDKQIKIISMFTEDISWVLVL